MRKRGREREEVCVCVCVCTCVCVCVREGVRARARVCGMCFLLPCCRFRFGFRSTDESRSSSVHPLYSTLLPLNHARTHVQIVGSSEVPPLHETKPADWPQLGCLKHFLQQHSVTIHPCTERADSTRLEIFRLSYPIAPHIAAPKNYYERGGTKVRVLYRLIT